MVKKSQTQQKARGKARIDSFWVTVNIGSARYWRVSSSGIEKTTPPTAGQGPVLTFDETSDFRFNSAKKLSPKDARSFFLTEHQEKCRVFSSDSRVFYGTPVARLSSFEHALYPGAYYIDTLLEKNQVTLTQDKVVGFNLQVGGPDEFNIVVLFARRQNGDMSPPQVALNPPDLNLTIREFADQFKASDEDPILFKVEDILGLQAGPGYPTEDLVYGTSVQTIKQGVAALLGAVTLTSGAISGYHYVATMSLTDQAKAQTLRTAALNQDVEKLLNAQVHAFAKLNSVDTDRMFRYAESLWSQYSLVTYSVTDRQSGVLKAFIPVQESGHDTFGRTSVKLNDFAEVKKQLNKPTEAGLSRTKITLSQDTSTYEVEYNFKPLDNDFSGLVGVK